MLENFDDFITEVKWNKRFELPLQKYLDMSLDPCLKLFLDVPPGVKEDDDDAGREGANRVLPANDDEDVVNQ